MFTLFVDLSSCHSVYLPVCSFCLVSHLFSYHSDSQVNLLFKCLFSVTSPACGRPSRVLPSQVKRIVGGRSAEPGLFPWQVLLSVEDLSRVPEDRWFGSGALLSDSWVITAAHVLRSQRRDTSVVPVAPDHVKV